MWYLILQLWVSLMSPSDLTGGVKFYGSWQSCMDNDGQYGEMAYDRFERGVHKWTLHLGPRDEFALYRGFGPDGDHKHDANNLLAPSYKVYDVNTWRGKRNWMVPSLNLNVNVVEAGGSRESCDSFIVKVEDLR